MIQTLNKNYLSADLIKYKHSTFIMIVILESKLFICRLTEAVQRAPESIFQKGEDSLPSMVNHRKLMPHFHLNLVCLQPEL